MTAYGMDLKKEKDEKNLTAYEIIQEIMKRFIGYEIVEHHKDYCIVKDLSEISYKEFDSSLRRIFLLIQQMGEEIIEAIKTENTEIIKHINEIDLNVDKFHDYCIRVLNKTNFKEKKKTSILFSTCFLLELIGDEFKNASYHIIKEMKGKNLKNLIDLSIRTLDNFNKFYDNFYSFNKDNLIELSKKKYRDTFLPCGFL